jgi:two-component system, cell cycle response regulator DivK
MIVRESVPEGRPSALGSGDEVTADTAGRNVMVVEDDPDAAEVASGMLRMLGYSPTVCPDAHQALYALASGPPDLILLDICLPEMDGVNLLKVARRVAEARNVPVIAASAVYPREGAIARSLRDLGVTVFLSKPFTLAGLREAIAKVMPTGSVARAVPPPLTMSDSLIARGSTGGREIELLVESGDDKTLTLTSKDVPINIGSNLQLRLTRRELVDDRMQDTQILVLGQVTECTGLAEGWELQLDVAAARPQRAFDRLVDALTQQG